jgi:hypothetical protein
MRGLALAALLCGCASSASPPATGSAPDLVYLVHNQLWRIALDGSGATKLATVGDDPHRTAFPRRLSDGRAALLADDTGAIYPYVAGDDGAFRRVGPTNVTWHDALTTVAVAGAPALVYTVTPFLGGRSTVMRAGVDGSATPVSAELDGELSEPAPWDDGAVLVVRKAGGATTIEILDVGGGGGREVLATVDAPYSAHAPARLRDGRVVFVRVDPRDVTDTAVGELFVLERGGQARTTGITGVLALVVVGDDIVYEIGGADGVSDLVRTNLVDAPVNITRTEHVSEHLGWSD